jgi:transposase InsO family protein
VLLKCLFVLLVIELGTRQVHILGVTTHGPRRSHRAGHVAVFASEGVRILLTPVRAPRANAFAERWVGTVRRELLDRMLIFGRRQLESALSDYVTHDNGHRPHRSSAWHHRRGPSRRPLQRLMRGCYGTIVLVG